MLATALLSFLPQLLVVSDVREESFDEPGTTWSNTRFPDVFGPGLPGAFAFVREPLDPLSGAPDTTPPLPINVGGDLEGRYVELGLAGSGAYALMRDDPANAIADVGVRGFVGIGNPDPFGSQSVGFVLRGSVNASGRVDAYLAELVHNGGNLGLLAVSRIRDGVITVADLFVLSSPFPVDLQNENYLLFFGAVGETLVARMWVTHVVGGVVTSEPIDLGLGTSPPNAVVVHDGELSAGRVGVRCFARGGNSALFEDVRVTALPRVTRTGFGWRP